MRRSTRKRRSKTRKTRKIRGGKLLGQGSYGCVYSPAVRCKGNNVAASNTVSKFMSRKDAEEERKNKLLLLTAIIPPEHRERLIAAFQSTNTEVQEVLDDILTYELLDKLMFIDDHFTFPTRLCEPDRQTPEESVENPLSSCDVNEANTLLQLPDAGYDWEHYLAGKQALTPKIFQAMIRSWIQLFDAVEFLHENDLVHMDIKPENITLKLLPSGEAQSRLIDYGFMFSTQNPRAAGTLLDTFGNNDYFVWPYEVRFLDPHFTDKNITPFSLANFRKAHVDIRSNPIPKSIYINKFHDFALNVRDLQALYMDLAKRSESDRANIIAKGCDVFALGRALYSIFDKMIIKGSNGYDGFIKLMEHMMNVDPMKRATIKEAKAEYQAWFASLGI